MSSAKVQERLELIDRMRKGGESLDPVFHERDVRSLLAEIDQVKAENEALRKDAERYRAIRDDIPHADLGRAILDVQSAVEYDSAVDAVMAKERGQ
jgi:hypothetical protein